MNYSFLAVVICAPEIKKSPSASDTLVAKLKDQLVERVFRDEFSDKS